MDDDSVLQQEDHQRYEVERVVELACKNLGPDDAALLRWAAGTQKRPEKKEPKWT